MDDLLVRAGLIVAAALLASALGFYLRIRARHPTRKVDAAGLAPGIHFFTSAGCDTCGPTRAKLIQTVGEHGYVEVAWEERPDLFERLNVDAVPAVLIVDHQGRGVLNFGRPDRALRGLILE